MDIATHGPTPASADRSWLGSIDRAVGGTVERIAAVLVAAEIVILFAGVVSRYLLHRPLTWSDELASTLFLWLAMFGSVIAIRQNAHMRMTALVGKLTPARRDFFEALATAAALAFCLLIASAALEYAYEESFITTPALELSGSWRASAFPVGIVLMTVFCLLRLATSTTVRHAIGAVALTAAIIAAFWLLGPSFKTLGNLNLHRILRSSWSWPPSSPACRSRFSFGLATFGYLALTTRMPKMVMVGRMDEGMSHLILLSVPLFVFLGLLIEMTGMARAMVHFLASLLGHVRGGLHYVLVGAMYLVSGISGSKAADMAAVAPVLFPEMKKRGAKPGDLVALLVRNRRADRNDPALHRADHHRLGHRRVDRGPVHRRAAARRRAGDHAVRAWCGGATATRTSPHVKRATWREIGGLPDRASRARAALRHPRGGGRRRRHRDRGLDHRHRLLDPRRAA